MLFDPATATAIDSLGWVEKGALWIFDARRQTARREPVPGAAYVSLAGGRGGFFRVVHHGAEQGVISVRRYADPGAQIARVTFDSRESRFTGDDAAWAQVESAAVVNVREQQLVWIDPGKAQVRMLDLTWYDADTYDLGYQGLTGCVRRPDGKGFIVSVQRSSDLVLLDGSGERKAGTITLAGGHGNPDLRLLSDGRLIATDYDTVAEVSLPQERMTRHMRLQPPTAEGMNQFIGEVFVLAGERQALVARPFSGDVLRLNLDDLRTETSAAVPFQPLTVCELGDQRFLCRDWQTGAVHVGQLPD